MDLAALLGDAAAYTLVAATLFTGILVFPCRRDF